MRLFTTMLGVALMMGSAQGCERREERGMEEIEREKPQMEPQTEQTGPTEQLQDESERMRQQREETLRRQGIQEDPTIEGAFEAQEQRVGGELEESEEQEQKK